MGSAKQRHFQSNHGCLTRYGVHFNVVVIEGKLVVTSWLVNTVNISSSDDNTLRLNASQIAVGSIIFTQIYLS